MGAAIRFMTSAPAPADHMMGRRPNNMHETVMTFGLSLFTDSPTQVYAPSMSYNVVLGICCHRHCKTLDVCVHERHFEARRFFRTNAVSRPLSAFVDSGQKFSTTSP